MNSPSEAAIKLGTAPTHTRTLADGCVQLGGCIANSVMPGWCAYCGRPMPPAWDWVAARQQVIVRAAQDARQQRRERQIIERRLGRFLAWRRLDAAMARGATWVDILRKLNLP
ncbi:hypothetical protein [Parafrankia sp. EUN1f]|uniref:hypothetical protein n=1 Tax=Parafrankia sp. EUN1f TaxID=102897 RepID=UPI0001C43F8B|nr:hypothetical protein [Parafrankia sp. EUN1f]EFC79230.1 hypothetical protein FrEUN1fDRAFT_7646 [Parafrankia sp. EUN1f]